ncbi:3'-5' RNA exonuclease complex component [Basidiobolus ranarum]|uniref:3'-5' RNA exonuclease complex component n=1 Tax=Basidiobolus ranarum TaxID=34480 RepID=A0ABR2W209_9FUNG
MGIEKFLFDLMKFCTQFGYNLSLFKREREHPLDYTSMLRLLRVTPRIVTRSFLNASLKRSVLPPGRLPASTSFRSPILGVRSASTTSEDFNQISVSATSDELSHPEEYGDINLEVGDLIEMRRFEKNFLGVVTSLTSGMGVNEAILYNGYRKNFRTNDVTFRISKKDFFACSNEELGIPLSLDTPIEELTESLTRSITSFQRKAVRVQWQKLLLLQKLYQNKRILRKESSLMIRDIAAELYERKPTPLDLYAVYLFLVKDGIRFIADKTVLRFSEEIFLRPESEVKVIQNVINRVRNQDPTVAAFVDKCKSIIEVKSTTKDTKSLKSALKDISFTSDDLLFIQFLRNYVTSYNRLCTNPYTVVVPSLLKPLKVYGDIEVDTVVRFLKDIGVWSPWENANLFETPVPLWGIGTSKEADQTELESKLYAKQISEIPITDLLHGDEKQAIQKKQKNWQGSSVAIREEQEMNSDTFYTRDLCESIRHDFGDLPVYTIDDPTAFEIDDGISIEKRGDETWFHVHVADPTSIIPPTHRLSQIAQERVQSVYLPERQFPLLPTVIGKEVFSLEKGASEHGNPTLTFSFRIGEDGNLIDPIIRPGLVHNVRSMFYEDVDHVIAPVFKPIGEWEGQGEVKNYTHPSDSKPQAYQSRKNTVPASAHDNLKEMQEQSLKHFRQRVKNGAFSTNIPRPNLFVNPFPLPMASEIPTGPRLFPKMPQIELSVDNSSYSASHQMVAEFMVMAGKVAALYMQERNIPTLYRSQDAPDFSKAPQDVISQVLSNVDPNSGMLSFIEQSKIREYLPSANITLEPSMHWSMGVTNGYTKVTSPLRRYVDLISHWQLKAHFLNHKFPFQRETLEKLPMKLRRMEKDMRILEQRTNRFWALEFLQRLQTEQPNQVYRAVITSSIDDEHVGATLTDFGVQGKLDCESALPVGTTLDVSIVNLNSYELLFELKQV